MEGFLKKICDEHNIFLNGVVYLGAEWAQEAPVFEQFGAHFVIWVEAMPSNIPIAKHHYLRGRESRQSIFNYAISDKDDQQVDFHIYNHPAASSFFAKGKGMNTWYPGHEVERTIKVHTITVDTLLERIGISPIGVNLLCMDLQGAELLGLKGATALLSSPTLQYVCSEVVWEPLYAGGCLLKDVSEYLANFGFQEIDREYHTPTYQGIESVPQADILFARKRQS